MTAHTKVVIGLLVGALSLGCTGKDMPDPKEPGNKDEPTLDAQPVHKPKELKAALIISSSPSGVGIKVNQKKVGETPLEVGDLDAGSHEVTFMFEGDPMTLTVELGEGETRKVHQATSPDASDAIMGN